MNEKQVLVSISEIAKLSLTDVLLYNIDSRFMSENQVKRNLSDYMVELTILSQKYGNLESNTSRKLISIVHSMYNLEQTSFEDIKPYEHSCRDLFQDINELDKEISNCFDYSKLIQGTLKLYK